MRIGLASTHLDDEHPERYHSKIASLKNESYLAGGSARWVVVCPGQPDDADLALHLTAHRAIARFHPGTLGRLAPDRIRRIPRLHPRRKR
jgi:hypothetical protein